MSSVSERFKRLPEEQILRNEESARQAREASELLKRLRSTRQEAEKLAKEEIERTRRIQREEVEMHPEIVDLKKRLRTAERDKDNWERKQRDIEKSHQLELDALKREEGNLTNRYNAALDEESKHRSEQEKLQRDGDEKERRFKDLEIQLENMKREEESQFINDMDVLKRQIYEMESKLPSGDFEGIKVQLDQVLNEIRNLQDAKDRSIEQRAKLAEKEKQAAEDLLKAQKLAKDAKRFEEEKKRELESLLEFPGGAENAQNNLREAEKLVNDLESSHLNMTRERESRNRSIEEKATKIESIRNEIERLQKELIDLERSQYEDYNGIYDLENKINRLDIELKDAKERFNDAKQNANFYAQQRSRNAEKRAKLEQEIGALQQARLEAENEEKRGVDLCDEIGKRCNEVESASLLQTDRIEKLNSKALELRANLDNFDRIKNEISDVRSALNQVQSRWNEWRINRRAPLQDEFDNLRNWLNSHPKFETVSTGRSQAVWKDLERVRNRVNELQNRFPNVPANFEDPAQLQNALKAKEDEIKKRLASRSGPASPRFLNQLEREAEAIMRAEVAATHERKQEAIERDASELSKLRLSLHPQVSLDEEARKRLWRLNQETGETGPIAEQVLQLCQNQNITVKPE